MKKLLYLCLILISTIAFAEEKVLTWDDTTPFPFGGDFKANGDVPLTGDGNAGGNAWTNLSKLNTDTIEIETGAAVGAVLECTNATTGQGTWRANPAFSVHRNGVSLLITNNTLQKVIWTTEEFDTTDDFANSRFTPSVPGRYLLTFSAKFDGMTTDGVLFNAAIYRNSSNYKYIALYSSTAGVSFPTPTVSIIVDVDASGTNYFEAYTRQQTGVNTNLDGTTIGTWFSGARLP